MNEMELKKLIDGLATQQYFDELGNPLREDPFFVKLADTVTKLEAPRKVEALVLSESYSFMGEKTTVCTLKTVFGHEVTGVSAPVLVEDFDPELGKKLARNHALSELEAKQAYLASYINSQKEK